MENKKQLIIVPPMSEALKKLNEVLEGISGDENIEISMIDDLKELGQVLATTGQCLILCSNAKKCATFLQENRFIISRFHTKVMLFTPKEIPAKTLVKFTKVGLTESILENSPPKTLLYKIKLQLRSIKSVTAQAEKEKEIVKSMLDTNADLKSATAEDIIVEKTETENSPAAETDSKKKNEESSAENVIDYGTNLKGKIKPQEEAIETHWKSRRKTEETSLDLTSSEEAGKDTIRDEDDIDQYYRGKSKKNSMVVEETENYTKLKRLEQQAAREENEARKKSQYTEENEADYMKSKKLQQEVYQHDDELEVRPSSPEMYLEEGEEKNKPRDQFSYEAEDLPSRKQSLQELSLEAAEKKDKQEATEDLGGHYKGKVSVVNLEVEPSLKEEKEESDYDNSFIDELKKKKTDIELTAEKKKRQNADESDDYDAEPHEGQVDHLSDENMNGDGATDHIETFMGGKTTTHSRSRTEEKQQEEELSEEKNIYDRDDHSGIKNKAQLDLEKAEAKEKTKYNYDDDETELKLRQAASTDIGVESEESSTKEDYSAENSPALKKAEKLKLEDSEKDPHSRNGNADSEDDQNINFKKLDNTQLEFEKNKKHESHSQVDQIDTYYRSGEARKTQHSWDNLVDKKQDTELALLKNRKADVKMDSSFASKDAGEITIDYRKLKQEFDFISRGLSAESTGAISHGGSIAVSEEEESSFKVREPFPRGLDLSIAVLSALYDKTIKPKNIYSLVAEDILTQYAGYTVFYSYKLSENKYSEVYDIFLELPEPRISADKKEWWLEFKKSTALFGHYNSLSMTTWRSPDVVEHDNPWEDHELPAWAGQELKDKKVELIFPYFDGLDKMGVALVFFPEGLNPENELSILTSLELVRSLLLEGIQRHQVKPELKTASEDENPESTAPEKKNILQFFGGIFGKKKAG